MQTIVSSSALILAAAATADVAQGVNAAPPATAPTIGRYQVTTLPLPSGVTVRSGTYTPSGKVLVAYTRDALLSERHVSLATVDDDGRNFRPFYSAILPERPKDNGVRFMIFADNKRIFLGDFVLECTTSLETCKDPALLPVTYPAEVAQGPHVMHRWSEMIIAPDNRHVAWTTLFNNGTAAVFTGELAKQGAGYVIAKPAIVSTLDPFPKDPAHADGVLPQQVRGGEVKQFIHGGAAISVAGGTERDIADSVVHHLTSGKMEVITQTPAYDETTIFSPDERLGVVMTSRFSPGSDPAILALMPRPYPDSLNMSLNWAAYTYAVTGVRTSRPGNVGPALIEIERSKNEAGYQGTNLNSDPAWVFNSPMSWHPSSTRALWPESRRGGGGSRRLQVLRLPDYRAGSAVAPQPTPEAIPYAIGDLSVVKEYASKPRDIDVKVYGRASGHITYRRNPQGAVEKTYVDFSDDGQSRWSGRETMQANPRGRSTYVANVTLAGPSPGVMKLKMTFGPLSGERPAELIVAKDATGTPLSHGYAEFGGKRLRVSDLTP